MPPESPRKRMTKVAEIQAQPEIKSENDQNIVQEAMRGSNKSASAVAQPTPDYPAELFGLKAEGDVVLVVKIDETGKVVGASVSQSSGYPAMDRNAIEVVSRRWKFTPAMVDGRPATQEVEVKLLFSYLRSRRNN